MINYNVAVFGAVYAADSRSSKGYIPVAETAFPDLLTVAEVYDVDAKQLHQILMRDGFCKVMTMQRELVVVALMGLYENNSSRAIH